MVLCEFGESKICNFGSTIMNEDVGDFQISVTDILFSQVCKATEDIFDKRLCCLLCEMVSFSQLWFEIALVTQFCNNVAISVACEYFKTA